MFVWKALNNSLPTKRNLFHKKVIKEPSYPVCKRQEESITHALWSCNGATDVWASKRSPSYAKMVEYRKRHAGAMDKMDLKTDSRRVGSSCCGVEKNLVEVKWSGL